MTPLLRGVQHLVVLDHLANATTEAAELVLPAGTFAESDGTLVNSEGRAQRFFQALRPEHRCTGELAMVARRLRGCGPREPKRNGRASTTSPRRWPRDASASRAIPKVAPSAQRVGKIAREPNRYSGRTAMLANISVHEPKPPDDPDSALAFSMESGPEAVTAFADSLLLGARMELRSGGEQISGRDRRATARW